MKIITEHCLDAPDFQYSWSVTAHLAPTSLVPQRNPTPPHIVPPCSTAHARKFKILFFCQVGNQTHLMHLIRRGSSNFKYQHVFLLFPAPRFLLVHRAFLFFCQPVFSLKKQVEIVLLGESFGRV